MELVHAFLDEAEEQALGGGGATPAWTRAKVQIWTRVYDAVVMCSSDVLLRCAPQHASCRVAAARSCLRRVRLRAVHRPRIVHCHHPACLHRCCFSLPPAHT